MKRRAADGDAGRPRITRRRTDGGEHRCDGRIGVDPLATDGWPAVTGSQSGLGGGEHRSERPASVRPLNAGHLLGRSLRHDLTAPSASLRPQVDHPVGPLDDVKVVLDHKHGVARFHEPLEDSQQLPHVGHVEAGRGLVEDVERLTGRPLGELPRELHPLGLAAGERGGGLAEVEVVEADVVERLQFAGDVGGVGKEFECLADLHVQQFGDVLPLPANLERVFGKPHAITDLTGHPDIGQEIHVEPDRAVALAGLAPPAGHVEAESPGLPAPLLGFREHREQAADVVPDLDVCGRVAPGRAADRRLVDHNHLVEAGGPLERRKLAGHGGLAAQQLPQRRLEHVANKRTLATARDSRHAHEQPQWDLDIDALEVVVSHAAEREPLSRRLASLRRHGDRVAAGEEGPRDALRRFGHLGRRTCRHHLPAPLPRSGSEVDHPVGRPDRLLVMLDNNNGIALVAKLLKRAEKLRVVSRVEANRRLVEHIEHAREARADLGGQPDPLALTAGERGSLAVKREVAEAYLVEECQPAPDLLEQFGRDHSLR